MGLASILLTRKYEPYIVVGLGGRKNCKTELGFAAFFMYSLYVFIAVIRQNSNATCEPMFLMSQVLRSHAVSKGEIFL